MITFSQLTAASAAHAIAPLSDLLQACVADGASVGFTDAGDRQVIERFWQARAAALADESHILLVAWQDQIPVATVTLSGSPMPNGYHRAEISKLLVHPQRRRQGISRQLMLQAEDLARAQKKRCWCWIPAAGTWPASSISLWAGRAPERYRTMPAQRKGLWRRPP